MSFATDQYGAALLDMAPCPPWAKYPGECQLGPRVMVRDEGHPCFGCPEELNHCVPGRVTIPTHTEAGTPAPFPTRYLQPPPALPYRIACLNDELFHAIYGPVTGYVSNLLDGDGNSFSSEVVSGTVVSASGQILTVKTNVNPLNLRITKFVLNPNFTPGDPMEPRFLYLGIDTRVQKGDLVGFSQSPLAGKVVCRVEEVLSTTWGGINATWSLRVTQLVNFADEPLLPLFQEARFGITREAIAPRNWPEFRKSHPLYITRREGVEITFEDVAASTLTPRVELLDTGGASTRVSIPVAPSGFFLGTFKATRIAGAVASDVTATVAAGLRVEHIGATDYRTTIDAGALLSAPGEKLVLDFEPQWRPGDGAETKRASCQSICHHSHFDPVHGWACGLAGRRQLDLAGDPASTPPSGLSNYREGSAAGCYQVGVCDEFERRQAWSYERQGAGFLAGVNNGFVAREDQGFPGSQNPNNFTTQRPLAPSGVPGLSPMAGRINQTPTGWHALQRLVPGNALVGWETGSGENRIFHFGAEIEITDGARQHDLSIPEIPKPGLFRNRTQGRARDSLGNTFNSATDLTFGFRDGGGLMPSSSRADSGVTVGLTEGDRQTATLRSPQIPRVSLAPGALAVQDAQGAQMTAQLGADDSLKLKIKPLGPVGDTGLGARAKVSGIIASASLDGGRIRVEMLNQDWIATFQAGPQFEDTQVFRGGGHFVKLSDAYSAYDFNDDESKIAGADPYRGAMPGDSARLFNVAGAEGDAIEATGFFVAQSRPCFGASEPWGPGNPAPPLNWDSPPKNYLAWLHKRDVVWLYDRADGVLSSNLAELVGASITCVVAGIIAPDGAVVIDAAEYTDGYSNVDAAQVQSVDRWLGEIVLKPSFIQSLDRSKAHCFRVKTGIMDRRRPMLPLHFEEIIRKQSTLDTIKGIIATGTDGRIYTADQDENPFSEAWGVDQFALRNIEQFAIEGLSTLLGTPYDPEIAEGPGPPQPECRPGFYVNGEAGLSVGAQPPGNLRNSFSVGASIKNPFASWRQLRRASDLRLKSFVGVGMLGSLAQFPTGTVIRRARCNVRLGDIRQVRKRVEFVGDGVSDFAVTETTLSDTTGSGSFKIGLYGFKVDPITGDIFAVPLGTGIQFSSTNDEFKTVDVTDVITQALNFKPSEWIALGLIPVPTIVDIAAGSDAAQALAGMLPDVDFSTYEPLYSGCGVGGFPTINPNGYDRAGSFETELIEWGDFAADLLVYDVTWPSGMGENILTLNDSNGHNWPPQLKANS